jgi:hypothetical protein
MSDWRNFHARSNSRQSISGHSRTTSEASFQTAWTERPGSSHSTRSITRDIDHIKALITKAQQSQQLHNGSNSPPSPVSAVFPGGAGTTLPTMPAVNPPKNIITAQVFRRNRATSSPVVDYAHIFSELDQLRKRLRNEQHQLQLQQAAFRQEQDRFQQTQTPRAARTFEIETSESELDTETEGSDSDEQVEELVKTREELATTRQNAEDLLEAAERRYDALLGEKERLEGSIHSFQKEAEEAVSTRDDALAKIEFWQTYKSDMVAEKEAVRAPLQKELDILKSGSAKLQAELAAIQEQSNALKEELSSLRQSKDSLLKDLAAKQLEMQTEKQATTALVAELEKKHGGILRDSTASFEGQLANQKTQSEKQVRDIEANHGRVLAELHDTHWKAIQATLGDRQSSERDQAASHKKEIERLLKDHKQERERLVADHENEIRRNRDEAGTKLQAALSEAAEDATRNLTRALREQHVNDLQDVDATTARAAADAEATAAARIAAVQAEHDATLASLKAQIEQRDSALQEKERSHEAALAKVKEEFEGQAQKLKGDHDSILAKASADHDRDIAELKNTHEQTKDDLQRGIDNLKSSHEASLASVKDSHNQNVTELRSTHEQDLASRKGAQEQALDQLRAELAEQSRLADERHRALETSHKDSLSQLETRHEASLASLRAEHQAQLDTEAKYALEKLSIAANVHDSSIRDILAKHEGGLADQQAKFEFRIAELETALRQAKAEAETHKSAVSDKTELEQEHQRKIEEIEQHWANEVDDIRNQHLEELQIFAKQTDEDEAAHKAMVAEIETSRAELEDAETKIREQQHQLEKLAESGKSESAETERLRSTHQQAIETLKKEHEAALLERQQKHDASLADAHKDKQDELSKMEAMIAQSLAEELLSVSKVHQKQTKKLTETHEKTLADRDNFWQLKLDNLTTEHDEKLAESRQLAGDSASDQVAQLKRRLEEELAAAAKKIQEQLAAAAQQHKIDLDAAVARQRQMHEMEVKKLKRRQKDAVAEVRSIMQNQSKLAMTELEEKHKQELEAAKQAATSHQQEAQQSRAVTNETHQAEVMRLESEAQVKLGELESKLRSEKARELEERQIVYAAELTALQARLDATLTGQAEAERALAVVRKQGAEGEKRVADIKSSMEEQLKALREEKNELATQLRQSKASLKEFESKLIDDDVEIPETETKTKNKDISPAPVSRRTSMHASEFNIARLEQELAAAQLLAQRRQDEKSEMVRQNDFLIKELEVLLAQRSHAKATSAGRSDAMVQTEQLISEPKVDSSAMRQIKADMQNAQRPLTPLTPDRRQAREEIDRAWHGRSFEGYLRQAQIELSDLDDVINANEVLFAEKLQEHVTDLQNAKDLLALEFQEKFDQLASEKARMEKMVTIKQQAAFAEERQRLIDIHSLDFGENSEQSSAASLRKAEQQAVADFSKRLAHRKSEIALKHAEQFQALTREYDQRVDALLKGKGANSSDFIDNAMKFDFGLDEDTKPRRESNKRNSMMSVISQQRSYVVEDSPSAPRQSNERFGRSNDRRSDSVTRTSMPRTSQSLPRQSSSTNLNRNSWNAPPLPSPASIQRPKTGNAATNPTGALPFRQYADGSGHYAPVTTHSLIRGKTPADVLPAFAPKTPTDSAGPVPATPRTPTGASAPLIMKASGAGPVIPMRRSIPSAVTTSVPELPRPPQHLSGLNSHPPNAQPPDFAQQQASTMARARESLSLERNSTRTTTNNINDNNPRTSPAPPPYVASAPPSKIPAPLQSTANHMVTPSKSSSTHSFTTTTPSSTRRTSGLFHLKRSVKQAISPSSPGRNLDSSRADETPSPSTSMMSGKVSSLRHSSHRHSTQPNGTPSSSVDRKRLSSGMIYWRPPKNTTPIFDAGVA